MTHQASRQLQRRQPPGWVILVACCGCAAGAIGICLNSVGVFYTAVSRELGSGRGAFAMHQTIASITTGLLCPLAAFLFQKHSTRVLMTVGVLLAAGATAAMSLADTLWMFYLLGFVRGIGCSLFASTPLTMIVGNWFPRRHGFAIGLVFCFSGLAGAVFSPLFSHLITRSGWRPVYLVMSFCVLATSLPGALMLRVEPLKMSSVDVQKASLNKAKQRKTSFSPLTLRFGLLSVFIFLCISITGVAQHFPGFAESIGKTSAFGAAMLSAAMLGNIAFKLLIGVISDKAGPVKACLFMGLINSGSLLFILLTASRQTGFWLFVPAFLYGSIYALGAVGIPLLVRHLYGSAQYASAFGYAAAVVSIGGAVSLAGIGAIYDLFNAYQPALMAAVASGMMGMVLLRILHRSSRHARTGKETHDLSETAASFADDDGQ